MQNTQKVGKLRYVILPDGRKLTKLTEAIDIAGVTSLIGGGGKTSTMFTLANELGENGQKVCITTTTKILPFANELMGNVTVSGKITENGKLICPDDIDWLKEQCDYLLIEADGSRGLPVKMPAEHEPVITDNTEMVIAVVGLSGVGKKIGDVCHRHEIVCDFLGKNVNDTVLAEDLVKIILNPLGLHKGVHNRQFVIVLNQADSEREIAQGLEVARLLPQDIPCVITAYESVD